MPLLILFLMLIPSIVLGQTYGTTDLPCAASSYWNTRIKDGAIRHVPDPVKSTGESLGEWLNSWRDRQTFVYVSGGGDPTPVVKHRTCPSGNNQSGNQSVCNESFVCENNTTTRTYANDWPAFTMKLPTTVNVGNISRDNPALFLDATDGILDGLYFERCTTTPNDPAFRYLPSKATSGGLPGERYAINGACMPDRGSSGASQLPLIGVIRATELSSAVGVDIFHTLAGALPATVFSNTAGGFVWPSKSADGCISNTPSCYAGIDTQMKMGSLLSIAASFDCNTLLTEPGKKICRAIRDFGFSMNEVSGAAPGNKGWAITIEGDEATFGGAGGPAASASYTNIRNAYQIDIHATAFIATCANILEADIADGADLTATRNFCGDMEDLEAQFVIISNNAAQCPKGCARPKIASCTNVDSTHSTCLLTSADLALDTSLTACTAFTITDGGTNRAISACSISGLTVSLTHAALTGGGVWRANYTEQGSGTARVRTVADAQANPAYELVGFSNQPITGGGGSSSALVCFAYSGGPPTANDTDTVLWNNVPASSLSTTNLAEGACWDGCVAEIRCLHDATDLWLYAKSVDSQSCPPSDGLPYRRDTFDWFIDKNNDNGTVGESDNFQVWMLSATPWADEGNSSGHTFTNARWWTTGGSRYAKIQIPWSTVGGAPSVGVNFGFNLQIHNGDTTCDDTREGRMSFNVGAPGGSFLGLGTASRSATSINLAVDDPAPGISFGSVSPIATTTASVNLTTDEAATCHVDYEIDPGEAPWDVTVGPSASGTSHTLNLTGLSANTIYDFQLRCSDGVNVTTDTVRTFTTQGVTPSTMRQSHFRMYHPGSPYSSVQPDTLTALAAEDTASSLMRGGIVTERFQLTCDGGAADCLTIGVAPYCSMDGGAYALVPATCASSDICYVTTFAGITNGQNLTLERLTSTYTNKIGQAFISQTVAQVGGASSDDTEQELVYYFQIATNAAAATIDCRLQQDGGTVLAGGYQGTPARLTLVSPVWSRTGF